MASRRERLRESRRQADPVFPLQTPPAHAHGQASAPSHQGRDVGKGGQGAPKEPRSRRKKKSNKGLKVTFDLDSVQKYEDKEEDVVDCWEDICDFDSESGEGKPVISEEDVIDCDRQLRDIGDDFLTSTDGLNAGDLKDAASDRRNLKTEECLIGEGKVAPGTGPPGLSDDSKVSLTSVADNDSDSRDNVNGKDAAFDSGSAACVSGTENVEASKRSVSDDSIQGCEGVDDSSVLPFIVNAEEDPNKGSPSDDDELETEPSGGSEETVIANWRKAGEGRLAEGESWQRTETEDDTVADEPSLNDYYGEDSDNLITKEDIEAVFLALMEDQENEPLPQALDSGGEAIEEGVNSALVTDEAVIPVSGASYFPPTITGEREQSPEVSIGYECRDRKPASAYGSETESEGELVPCEDKCIGTADFLTEIADDVPLDLSLSKGAPSKDEETADIGDECQGKPPSLSSDEHQASEALEAPKLYVPDAKLGDLSPSAEVEVDVRCIGKSESGKEEKINGKKAGKKKGKKNKKEAKSEAAAKPPQIEDRPKLVRGKGWREKRDRFRSRHGKNPFNPSEGAEGASGPKAETPTDGGTEATEAPRPASPPDCGSGEATEGGAAVAPEAEAADVEAAAADGGGRSDGSAPAGNDDDDFFLVKACTVARPSEVLTEYVADSESSEGESLSRVESDIGDEGASTSKSSDGDEELLEPSWDESSSSAQKDELLDPFWSTYNTVVEKSVSGSDGDSWTSGACNSRNPAYLDAQGSSCTDSLIEPFDYIQAFPGVVGTQKLNRVASYDEPVSSFASHLGRGGNRSQTSVGGNSEESGVIDVTAGGASEGAEPAKGEIVYEGPCSCGGRGRVGIASEDEQLCVPTLLSDDEDGGAFPSGNGRSDTVVSDVHDPDTNSSMGSNPEGLDGEHGVYARDIRSRIDEIVGPRLRRERPREPKAKEEEEEEGAIGGPPEDPSCGREDSPLPGSSPASSSGVQGSDEMSLSRSRSRSPPAPYGVPDLPCGADSSPEKAKEVDCSFRTLREMYQINPAYLTDSEGQDECDSVVPGPSSPSHGPERSAISVSSWVSASQDSSHLQEPGLSPPLPGTQATRKAPKVSRLLRETQGIVQRWEVVQAQAVERQRQRGQIRELQRQVKALRQALEALSGSASELSQAEDIDTHRQLTEKLQEAKGLQQEVLARKVEVSRVNLAVHRFHTETGYSLAPLKDDVADLFRVWDEADRRINSEVSRLEGVEATWRLWEAQAEELAKALRQDGDTLKVLDAAIQTGPLTDTVTASVQGVARLLNDRRKTHPGKKLLLQHTKTQGVDIQGTTVPLSASGDECLSDSGTSGYESCSSEEFSERERRLAHLRKLARDLEASLHPNSQAWASICKTLSSAETELKGLQKHCRELVVRSAETLDQAKTSPQLRRRSWAKDSKAGRASRRGNTVGVGGRDPNGRASGRRGWMWRVVRAALPFQAALLLLFCVACLLEPNCCDHVNTLNLSLSPQLRYVHGPPPV